MEEEKKRPVSDQDLTEAAAGEVSDSGIKCPKCGSTDFIVTDMYFICMKCGNVW